MKRFLLAIGIIAPLFFVSLKVEAQTISASTSTGSIAACAGTVSPGTRQFTISGSNLTAGITVAAPANFEVSLSLASGYSSNIMLPQSGGTVYVRSAASAASGDITGNVTLTSEGAPSQTVLVTGIVNALPTVEPQPTPAPIYANGATTTAIDFSGTANTYTWTNNTPSIGLAASGTGNIPSFTAVNTTGSTIVANIQVTPFTAPIAYIANSGDGAVSVINTATNKELIPPIQVGTNPIAVSVSPDGSFVYVANNTSGTVSVINTITNMVTATINVGATSFPDGLIVSPDGSKVYVANNALGTVSVINTATNTLSGTIYTVGADPYGIAISPNGNDIYVSNTGSGNISDINISGNSITNIPTGTFPNNIAVSKDGSTVYVTNQVSGTISVINAATDTKITDITIGPPNVTALVGEVLSPDGSLLYVANAGSAANNVAVITTLDNHLKTTIPVGTTPYGVSITPDGSQVYVTNEGANSVSVINTQTNIVSAPITVGTKPYSFGNFIKAGIICSGPPVNFTITVTPPVIMASAVTGNITACAGTASANPNIQQFSVTGSALSADITAAAPQNFEISLSATSGYGSSVTLMQSSGIVNSTIVYVRAAASAMAGSIAGNVVLTSDGASKNVAVSGMVNALPTVDAVPGQIVVNGASTTAITFSGTANTYSWTNDNPAIGLAGGGTGDISSFTAVNTGNSPAAANITVTPEPAPGVDCTGSITTFTITVNPTVPTPVSITAGVVTGSISACAGMASASPDIQQFTVSGSGLSNDIIATAPAGFEVSLTSGSGYGGSVTMAQTGGTVNNTVVYVRSAASDSPGPTTGNVMLTSTGATSQNIAVIGTVNALPTVNAIPNQIVLNGTTTTAVNFTGTANAYSWVNDTPGIGLAASGTGNIASFSAINTSGSPVVATITATPVPTGFAYIGNTFSNNVSVIDIATNKVIATIPVGLQPFGVAVSKDGSKVYIANSVSGTVSVISAATNSVIATINEGSYPYGIVVSPDGSRVYAANYNDGTVAIINTTTNLVIATIPSGPNSFGITISPDGDELYVANYNLDQRKEGTVTVINTATYAIAATINTGIGSQPFGISISPDGRSVYSVDNGANAVSVINTANNSVIATIPVGIQPQGIAVSPDGSRIYVPNGGSDFVSVIDAANNTVISTIKSGPGFMAASLSSDGSELYLASDFSSTGVNGVEVINTSTNTIKATVNVGLSPNIIGNFVSGGSGCNGIPITFTITVNPTGLQPAITASTATGNISACEGTASTNPNIQQFTISGSNLTVDITATAPTGFEVSLNADNGYGNSVALTQSGGLVSNEIVYVRSGATASSGPITGNVMLTSTGATSQSVAVTGIVNVLAMVNTVANQVVLNGATIKAINFTGTADTFSWVNDTPDIGLPANGTGNIPSFIAVNTGSIPVTATITVIPLGAENTGCSGVPVTFTITINPSSPSALITVPNAFTPNNDGINDTWNIKNLDLYPKNTVDVYNRYGEKVYSSIGYGVPWDGRYGGRDLPTGTYYYIIDLKNGIKVLSGDVTIIR